MSKRRHVSILTSHASIGGTRFPVLLNINFFPAPRARLWPFHRIAAGPPPVRYRLNTRVYRLRPVALVVGNPEARNEKTSQLGAQLL